MGFGIVVAISALVFFIMTIISSVLKSKGVDYAPLANFFSAMTIMASMGVLFIGSIIVIVISLTKK